MPRTRSLAWSELKIGVVGVVAIALTALLVVTVGGQGGLPWQRYPLKTKFDDAAGLKSGAVVRVSGKEVGKVTGVEFVGAQIEVGMTISKTVRRLITTDSRSSIGSISLLGESIIEISSASTGTPLADNAYVSAAPPVRSFAGLADTAGKGLDQINQVLADLRAGRGTAGKLFSDEAVYNELQKFIASASRVTASLETTKGTAGSLINDPKAYTELTASLENLRAVTTRLNNGEGPLGALLNDPAMTASLKGTTTNVQAMTDRLNKGEGTMGKLINERELYDRINSVSKHLDDVTAALTRGEGTVGQLLHDRQLYDNMNSTVNELKALIGDIRKDPKKYLNVKVSIF